MKAQQTTWLNTQLFVYPTSILSSSILTKRWFFLGIRAFSPWLRGGYPDSSPILRVLLHWANEKLRNSQNRFGSRVGHVLNYTRLKGMASFHTWGRSHSLLFNVSKESYSSDGPNHKGEIGISWSSCHVRQNIQAERTQIVNDLTPAIVWQKPALLQTCQLYKINFINCLTNGWILLLLLLTAKHIVAIPFKYSFISCSFLMSTPVR